MEWLDILTDRFPDDAIKSRQGRGGKNYSYLDTPTVIARLNVAFGGSWSFEVLGHWILDNEVVVQGKLTGNGITKEQFGESETERFSEGHKNAGRPLSIGDDLKSATSDCLKKCATLFGVGLEQLYTGKPPGGNGEGGQPPQKSGPAQEGRHPPGGEGPGAGGHCGGYGPCPGVSLHRCAAGHHQGGQPEWLNQRPP